MLSNPAVDSFFISGCGRCSLYDTPECKVHLWTHELQLLRSIILESGLEEERKWGIPCYTFKGNNVLVLSALKKYCTVGFFKGTLLKDEQNLLKKPGDNSQAVRMFTYTSVQQISQQEAYIKSYIAEAIELEEAGMKVEFKKNPEPMPEELIEELENNSELKKAFYALTPGRQRGYIIHFSQPKQSITRISRIEKCTPQILLGKGFHD